MCPFRATKQTQSDRFFYLATDLTKLATTIFPNEVRSLSDRDVRVLQDLSVALEVRVSTCSVVRHANGAGEPNVREQPNFRS
jgi:hypothetical protein